MATNFPSSIDAFTNPTSGSSLSSPSHSQQHADVNDAVEALQAKVGVDGSAVTTSLDYKVANQGLMLVKSQTVGSGVSSVTVSNAFSSTFDNYIIFLSGGSCSTDDTFFLTYGSSTTSYYGKLIYGSFLSSGVSSAEDNNNSRHTYNGGGNSSTTQVEIHVYNPYLSSVPTEMWSRVRYLTVYGTYVGYHGELNSYTSFTLTRASGTMTGGTIRVYGYNNG